MLVIFDDLEKGHCRRAIDKIDKPEETKQIYHAKAGDVVQLKQLQGGHVTDTDGDIIIQDVAIITPCGDVVVSSLTLQVGHVVLQGAAIITPCGDVVVSSLAGMFREHVVATKLMDTIDIQLYNFHAAGGISVHVRCPVFHTFWRGFARGSD
ncbi:hypothetical protein QZH41_005897 [Actinostola sp. cb2023]|nr:hypothetical protein QZH41_005897 [Actinostola sp. cb2023]